MGKDLDSVFGLLKLAGRVHTAVTWELLNSLVFTQGFISVFLKNKYFFLILSVFFVVYADSLGVFGRQALDITLLLCYTNISIRTT